MASALLRLIRAKAKGQPVGHLATVAGIPYSRAHGMLKDQGEHRQIANLEKALRVLAPGLMKRIENEADKAEKAEP
jgi:DNA-binding IclR family transcriptional regulator